MTEYIYIFWWTVPLNAYVHWVVEGKSTLHHQVGFPAPHRSMLKYPAMGNDPKETVVCLLWNGSIFIPMLIYFDAVPTHQYGVRVVPHVPQDPEPHGATEQLCLKLLVLGELRRLSVLGFNMRDPSCPKTWPSERLPGMYVKLNGSWLRKKRWYMLLVIIWTRIWIFVSK